MESGPDLVAAEGVSLAVGDVADGIVGYAADVGVTVGRSAFDRLAGDGEVLAGDGQPRNGAQSLARGASPWEPGAFQV